MVIVLPNRNCLVYRWLYCGSYINMKKNKKAINTLDYAVEYFDMNYNTGDKKTDKELKDAVWKALNYVDKKLKYKEDK